jgi:hypothetical protein
VTRHSQTSAGKNEQGLSYVEVLIATVLVMVSLVPAIEALHPAIQGAGIHETEVGLHFHLTARLENVLAEPFVTLDAEAQALADPTAISAEFSDAAGSTNRRLVFVSRYDADNADADNNPFTGVDEGLLWIRVEVENTSQALETLLSAHD